MKTLHLCTAAALSLLAAPAFAADPAPATANASAGVKAGATIYDPAGGQVGTVKAISGDLAVVSTGKNDVSLPISSFAAGEKGPFISVTRDQLDQMAAAAKAEAASQVAAGATVTDKTGATIGTVKEADAQFALVETPKAKVRLPLSAFSKGANGPVLNMTAAEVDAAISASAPAAKPSGS